MTQEKKRKIIDWLKTMTVADVIKIAGMFYFCFQCGGWYKDALNNYDSLRNDIAVIRHDVTPLPDEIKNLTSAVDQKCDSMNNYNYYKTYWEQNYLYAQTPKKENHYNRN